MNRRKFDLLVALCATLSSAASAADFRFEHVPAVSKFPVEQIGSNTIIFSELATKRPDELPGLLPFEQWAREHALQHRVLSPSPEFKEPVLKEGATLKLTIYVAEARFRLPGTAQTFNLAQYTSLSFLQRLDPSIIHRPLLMSDAIPNTATSGVQARPAGSKWCEHAASCFHSRYDFEGKIPAGILLANKLRDETKKPIPNFIEFQSEVRLLSALDAEFSALPALTEISTPVKGALTQTIFWANQVIYAGKLLAVIQEHPSERTASIATVYLMLAIRSDIMTKQRDFRKAPVLRNLVPSELLMGRSSFNSGTSISAGLPQYARSRMKALAASIQENYGAEAQTK